MYGQSIFVRKIRVHQPPFLLRKGNREAFSVPERKRSRGKREQRVALYARKEEKQRKKGTESRSLCPKRKRSRGKGNRESLSVPERKRSRGKREQRVALCARKEEKQRKKGTEKHSLCPKGRETEEKGNRESCPTICLIRINR